MALDNALVLPPGLEITLSVLFNFIELKLFLSNTIPLSQPMNQGVITNFEKSAYERNVLKEIWNESRYKIVLQRILEKTCENYQFLDIAFSDIQDDEPCLGKIVPRMWKGFKKISASSYDLAHFMLSVADF